MVEMHEMVPGKRFDRYHELGQEAFGPKLGLWIVVPQQLIVQVGVDIVYMVTGGKSLQKFYTLVCKGNCNLKKHTSLWIVIFGSVHFFLSQLPNFNSISGISLAAAIMSLRSELCLEMIDLFSHGCTKKYLVCKLYAATHIFILGLFIGLRVVQLCSPTWDF
jgi:hypothetical protein